MSHTPLSAPVFAPLFSLEMQTFCVPMSLLLLKGDLSSPNTHCGYVILPATLTTPLELLFKLLMYFFLHPHHETSLLDKFSILTHSR